MSDKRICIVQNHASVDTFLYTPLTYAGIDTVGCSINIYSVEQVKGLRELGQWNPSLIILNSDAADTFQEYTDTPIFQWCNDSTYLDTNWRRYSALIAIEHDIASKAKDFHCDIPIHTNGVAKYDNMVLYAEWHTAHKYGGAAQASYCIMADLRKRGYAVTRVNSIEVLDGVTAGLRPNVVMICGDLPVEAINKLLRQFPDTPFIQYIQDPKYVDFRWDEYHSIIVNSEYVRNWVKEQGGPDSTIQIPLLSPKRARIESTTRKYILDVHMSKHKGLHIFKALVNAMPNQKFMGLDQSHTINSPQVKDNLVIMPWHDDIRKAYEKTAVLIQPSVFLEAFCRAVCEAVGNGIPCVVSEWGNLPYLASLFPDMIKVVHSDAPISEWVDAVEWALSITDSKHEEVWDYTSETVENAIKSCSTISKIDQKMSICITLKNRADFLDGYLKDLKRQNYDLKNIEICISDGNSTDNLKEVMKKHANTFGLMKYGLSDRSKLPFPVKSNNPAADINAQVCHLATYEKIIRTDAEMRYKSPNTLSLIAEKLEDKEICFTIPAGRLLEGIDYPEDGEPEELRDHWLAGGVYVDSFFCSCFNKSQFIKLNGVDERYCLGFAAEDTYFHWYWKKNSKFASAPTDLNHKNTEYMAYHLYHTEPMTEAYRKIRDEYTLPLMNRMKATNERPNTHCIGMEWQRKEMLSNIEYIDNLPIGITVHCMVRNEPLTWYAVNSVYPYVDKILIYDDSSNDEFTKQQLQQLIQIDTERKITVRTFNRKYDGTRWNYQTYRLWGAQKTDEYKKSDLRRMMMEETQTSHFMILDGDEIHYPETMEAIQKTVKNWPDNMLCGTVPLTWYASINKIHGHYGPAGRVFKTSAIGITDVAPGEMHTNKVTGNALIRDGGYVFDIDVPKPYAHFEAWLKPWRRDLDFDTLETVKDKLPPVMYDGGHDDNIMSWMERYVMGRRPAIINNYIQEASQYDSLLEIGVGEGSFLPNIKCKRKVGIDAWEPSIQIAQSKNPEAEMLCMRVEDIKSKFMNEEFDMVMGIDIIEHMSKDVALKALADCETLAKECLLFFIPTGNHPQIEDPYNLGNDYFQTHRSTWEPEEMAELGYEVWEFADWHAKEEKEHSAMWCIKRKNKPYLAGTIHKCKVDV